MLVSAAICPHPPLLVPAAMGQAGSPDTAAGPPADIDTQMQRLREACFRAVTIVGATVPDLIVIVGGGSASRTYPASAAGTLRGFGVPMNTGSGEPVLPLSLTVGRWLLGRCVAGQQARVELREVAASTPPQACLRLGRRLAAAAPRVALLGMGDGTARKVLGVPGAPDPAAERYDAGVAAALAACDTAALAGLDPRHDAEYLVAGRAAWQVLAGAAGGAPLDAQLGYAAAPLDVSYFVASWQRRE